MAAILEKAEQYVTSLANEKLTENHIFHNLNHILETVEAAEEISQNSGISGPDLEAVILAAWFHDIGHVEIYDGHEEISARIASEFLSENNYSEDQIEKIEKLIMVTKIEAKPSNLLEEIIRDADIIHIGKKGSLKKGSSLREEWKLIKNQNFSAKEWLNLEIDFYSNTQFYTDYAKQQYDAMRLQNISKLKKKIQKSEEKKLMAEKTSPEKFEKEVKKAIKTRMPERGIETVFRLTSRNHIRLSAIADNKANTLISINAIIISIVLSILIDKLELSTHLIVPTVVMLATCVITIILAILSTKPKVTHGGITRDDIKNRRGNLLFFGNFYDMSLEDYEWGMNELMNDRDFLYHNLIQDVYYLGLVLEKKYRYLRWAYTIFMFGLILSVVAFLAAVIIVL